MNLEICPECDGVRIDESESFMLGATLFECRECKANWYYRQRPYSVKNRIIHQHGIAIENTFTNVVEKLKAFLENIGFCFIDNNGDNALLFEKTINGRECLFCLFFPHSGNDFKFVFRGEPRETFDRWSNCLWECSFDDEEDFKSRWYEIFVSWGADE